MRTNRLALFAAVAALALLGAACAGDDATPTVATSRTTQPAGPSVSITSPKDGAHIAGNVVSLALQAKDIAIVKADGDTSGTTGHFHVFVDKVPVAAGAAIDKAPGIIHSIDDPLLVPGLSVGKHTLTVVLGNGNHQRIGNSSDSVTVTVDGPSLDATAPAAIKSGQPLSIDVAVVGVTLVKADGDTSGKTGHLHAFVDVPPVAPGAAIPTDNAAIIHSVIQGLAPGEHTIWVVLGDGTHTAFKDSVRDKVTVVVG
jgi:uncharacterized protein (DUF736 family)